MEYEIIDVRNAIENKNKGFENLYKSIYADLFKLSFYILGNREMAEEVVSDTILDAYCGIGKLRDENKFEQWILRILNNKCKKKMRDKYDKITVFNPNVSEFDSKENNLSGNANYEISEMTDIEDALNTLSKEERTIVILSYIQGYKSREIAKIMRIKESTVRSKLSRSIEKLQKYLEVE